MVLRRSAPRPSRRAAVTGRAAVAIEVIRTAPAAPTGTPAIPGVAKVIVGIGIGIWIIGIGIGIRSYGEFGDRYIETRSVWGHDGTTGKERQGE
jgi:hypothetical protein